MSNETTIFPFEVVLWAIQPHTRVTIQAISDRWSVSRATAYRWRNGLNDARAMARAMGLLNGGCEPHGEHS